MKKLADEYPPEGVEVLCWDVRRGFKLGYWLNQRGGSAGKFWTVGGASGGSIKPPTHWDALPNEPEDTSEPRLIRGWSELAALGESKTHRLKIDVRNCNGWLHDKSATPGTMGTYLSTHTFYGSQYEHSTSILRKAGFDVQLANWDQLPPEPVILQHRIPGTESRQSNHAGYFVTEVRGWYAGCATRYPDYIGDGFYFNDEVEQVGGGPYDTMDQAVAEWCKYGKAL
jgi:hypothetical protein